jgi:hypothetical protein
MFIGLRVGLKFEGHTRCPGCMHRQMVRSLPLALLTSGLSSPFVAAWWFGVLLQTFRRPDRVGNVGARSDTAHDTGRP